MVQVVIFVRDKRRCATLNKIEENKFQPIERHSDMLVEERLLRVPGSLILTTNLNAKM